MVGMNDSDLEAILGRFGFSAKEVATYLVVIDHGEIQISSLAEKAEVSVRYAYNVSERLEEQGLVLVDNYITPTVVRAVSPSESIADLKDDLSMVESELNTRFVENQFEHQVEVLKTQSTLFKRIRETIRTAETEIILSIPAQAVPDIAAELRNALDRGVFILLLLTGSQTAVTTEATIASVVCTWDENVPTVMAVDGWKGLLSPGETIHKSHSHKISIYIHEYHLIPTFIEAFLGYYWRCGAEISLTRPHDLPHEYTSFRHAVFDGTCLLKQGVDLHAEIKVRSTATSSGFETIRGQVVETRQSIIEPRSSSLPIENTLLVQIGDDIHSIGGPGAFIEEYEAKLVRLWSPEMEANQ